MYQLRAAATVMYHNIAVLKCQQVNFAIIYKKETNNAKYTRIRHFRKHSMYRCHQV